MRVLLGVAGLVLLARLAAAVLPTTAPWALSIGRFVPGAAGPGGLALGLVLVAWAFLHPRSPSPGRTMRAALHPAVPLIAGLAVILLLPDRLHFLGDSIVRQGEFDRATYVRLFPQASPLDVYLFTALRRLSGLSGSAFGRLLGAIGFLGVWFGALRFARWAAQTPESRAVAVWTVSFSGCLVFCTGYLKVTPLLCGAVAVAVACSVEALASRAALVPAALSVSLAALLHRSGLAVLPAGLFVLLHHARSARDRWPTYAVAAGVIAVAGGFATAHAVVVLRQFDVPRNLLLHDGMPAIHGRQWGGFVNVLWVLAPALPFLILLPLVRGRAVWRAMRLPFLTATAVLAVLALVHPPQGAIRDWDVFALGGLLLSLAVAGMLGHLLDRARPGLPGALALIAVVALPSLQWVVNAHDRPRGLARVADVAAHAPMEEAHRAQLFDYLGSQYMQEGRWEDAADALQRAVTLAPHRRLYLMWALAETGTGDYREAGQAYGAMLHNLGPDPLGYLGLAGAAAARGDTLTTRRALEGLMAFPPEDRSPCITYLRRYPQVWPSDDREVLLQVLESPRLAE